VTMLAVDFGPIVTAADVRNAVQSTISLWSRTYLDEMARRDGQSTRSSDQTPTLPDFRSYPDAFEAVGFPEDQLPSCALIVPGLTRKPERKGRGAVTAPWSVGVGVVVSAPDRARTIRLAELYTAAVRTLLVQHPSLGGFASGVTWLGERFTPPGGPAGQRTFVAGVLQFEVTVDEVVDTGQGPTQPIDDGSTPVGWPTVATPQMGVSVYTVDEEIPRP
jgi:hypothetical protein